MKSSRKLLKPKSASIQLDTRLNKLENQILFPEKLQKANEKLKRIGLPLK